MGGRLRDVSVYVWAVPWLGWRFSLGTLLIATAVVAVVLSLATYFLHG